MTNKPPPYRPGGAISMIARINEGTAAAAAEASAIDRAALATDQAMRAAFERWMIDTAKIIIGSQDPYPAGLERDFWRVWQAAWRAGRELESRKNSRTVREDRAIHLGVHGKLTHD